MKTPIACALMSLVTWSGLAASTAAEPVMVQATRIEPVAGPEGEVLTERLRAELAALPTNRASNGRNEHLDGLRQTEDLLLEKLKQLGYVPKVHEFDFLGSSRRVDDQGERVTNKPWRNIIVEIPGKGRSGEVLVFAAHFDAVPRSPGADDNGSGTVALLEVARLLKDRPMQRTLRLCFFNCEEVGLVGSRAYVQSIQHEFTPARPKPPETGPGSAPDSPPAEPVAPTYRILGMVSLDGIGFYSTAPDSQKSPIPENELFKAPTVGDFLGMGGILKHRRWSRALDKALRDAEPALKTVVVDFLPIAPPDLLRSDHAAFLAAGVPAVILADTANFRNPHYHQPTDTAETLDWDRYAKAVKACVGAAFRLCGPVGGELPELEAPRKPVNPASGAAEPKSGPGEKR